MSTKPRLCGFCRKPGHTWQKCPERKSAPPVPHPLPTRDPLNLGRTTTRLDLDLSLTITLDGTILISEIKGKGKKIEIGSVVKAGRGFLARHPEYRRLIGVVYKISEPVRYPDCVHVSWIKSGKQFRKSQMLPLDIEVIDV